MRCRVLAFLALACTHSQPAPPPLASPAGAATPVAQTQGVVARPEERPPAPPLADLASPITAAGVEEPAGLDWKPEVGERPATATFKNVKVLGDVTGSRFMAAMQSMKANLGQKCALCHQVEHRDFAADSKKEKLRAREMIHMTAEIDVRTFDQRNRVTCWTCHRGEEKPPAMAPFGKELPEALARMPPEQLAQPAELVFKDVRELKGMKARDFGLAMAWFARELGVKCTHCHQERDFAADTPKKTRARQMLQMTSYVAHGYYKDDSPIGCGTCHRGQPEPPRVPSDLVQPR